MPFRERAERWRRQHSNGATPGTLATQCAESQRREDSWFAIFHYLPKFGHMLQVLHHCNKTRLSVSERPGMSSARVRHLRLDAMATRSPRTRALRASAAAAATRGRSGRGSRSGLAGGRPAGERGARVALSKDFPTFFEIWAVLDFEETFEKFGPGWARFGAPKISCFGRPSTEREPPPPLPTNRLLVARLNVRMCALAGRAFEHLAAQCRNKAAPADAVTV
jgi:hypothetical protein